MTTSRRCSTSPNASGPGATPWLACGGSHRNVGRRVGGGGRHPPPRLSRDRRPAHARGRRPRPALRRAHRARRRAAPVGLGRGRDARVRRDRLGGARADAPGGARSWAREAHGALARTGGRALQPGHAPRAPARGGAGDRPPSAGRRPRAATLWHVAERWGRVGRDSIVVDLPLSHQRLADLVGAHRPTVTRRRRAPSRSRSVRRARVRRSSRPPRGSQPHMPRQRHRHAAW